MEAVNRENELGGSSRQTPAATAAIDASLLWLPGDAARHSRCFARHRRPAQGSAAVSSAVAGWRPLPFPTPPPEPAVHLPAQHLEVSGRTASRLPIGFLEPRELRPTMNWATNSVAGRW